jgi:hypothetical protein
MMRTALSSILIALVVVCPYFCLGNIAGDAGARTTACSCCQTCGTSGDECPGNSDTGEPDCLCHGAILSKVESSESAADNFCVHIAISSLVDNRLNGIASSALDESLSSHFPPLSSGREICSLICVQLL